MKKASKARMIAKKSGYSSPDYLQMCADIDYEARLGNFELNFHSSDIPEGLNELYLRGYNVSIGSVSREITMLGNWFQSAIIGFDIKISW